MVPMRPWYKLLEAEACDQAAVLGKALDSAEGGGGGGGGGNWR